MSEPVKVKQLVAGDGDGDGDAGGLVPYLCQMMLMSETETAPEERR
jgi:hypothetical protein